MQLGNWGGVINPGGQPVRGGTLRVDMAQSPSAISPLAYLSSPDNAVGIVALQMFDQLVEYVPGFLDPQPGLAQSWTVSPDGLTYTFNLRDAQFSNGMPVTSADVKYVLDRARGKDSFFSGNYGVISSVEAPDAKTVILHLPKPSPALIYFIAYVAVSIVPAQVVTAEGVDAFNKHPIGSGPFVLSSWTKDQEIVLDRNKNYWRAGQPYLDEVRLIVKPDGNTRVLDLQTGTVDVIDRPDFSQIANINKGQKAKVLVTPGGDMNDIWIDNSKPPLSETVVRQALNYATPVDSIVKVVFAGLAPRMNTIMPKMKYWPKDLQPYPYDINKAKQLLAQSSAPNGFAATVTISSDDAASLQEAEIIQGAWKQIGVNLTIKPLDLTSQTDQFFAGNYQFALFPPGIFTTDIPVEDEFASLLFDNGVPNNFSTYYKNQSVTNLVEQAIAETSEAKRVQLFAEMHKESMADPPMVPLTYTPNRAGVANNVHAFNYLLGGLFRLESVWIH